MYTSLTKIMLFVAKNDVSYIVPVVHLVSSSLKSIIKANNILFSMYIIHITCVYIVVWYGVVREREKERKRKKNEQERWMYWNDECHSHRRNPSTWSRARNTHCVHHQHQHPHHTSTKMTNPTCTLSMYHTYYLCICLFVSFFSCSAGLSFCCCQWYT